MDHDHHDTPASAQGDRLPQYRHTTYVTTDASRVNMGRAVAAYKDRLGVLAPQAAVVRRALALLAYYLESMEGADLADERAAILREAMDREGSLGPKEAGTPRRQVIGERYEADPTGRVSRGGIRSKGTDKSQGRRKKGKGVEQSKRPEPVRAQAGVDRVAAILDALTPEERQELEAVWKDQGWDGSPEHLAALLNGA